MALEKIFKVFPMISLLGAKDHSDVANLDPMGMVGRIYVGDHLALLLAKYISCVPHGVRKEDFKVVVFSF